MRLIVIVDERSHEVVATQQVINADHLTHALWSGDSHKLPVYRRIVAGPGQRKHEVEIEIPEAVFRTMDAEWLHAAAHKAVNKLAE